MYRFENENVDFLVREFLPEYTEIQITRKWNLFCVILEILVFRYFNLFAFLIKIELTKINLGWSWWRSWSKPIQYFTHQLVCLPKNCFESTRMDSFSKHVGGNGRSETSMVIESSISKCDWRSRLYTYFWVFLSIFSK